MHYERKGNVNSEFSKWSLENNWQQKLEKEHTNKKCKIKIDISDLEVRNAFPAKIVALLVIKCASRCNYCRIRNTIINDNAIGSEHPRFSEEEMQKYIIKCRETQ